MYSCSHCRSGCVATHPPKNPRDRPNPGNRRLYARRMATAAEVKGLLSSTSVPSALVDDLVDGAAATWLDRGLALLRLFVTNPGALDWDSLGERLRSAVGRREQALPPFVPTPPAEVEVTSAHGDR